MSLSQGISGYYFFGVEDIAKTVSIGKQRGRVGDRFVQLDRFFHEQRVPTDDPQIVIIDIVFL